MDDSVFRVIDANLNRCHEGLRVLEDHARFCGNQPRLAEELKEFRHNLQASIPDAWSVNCLKLRDVAGDPGTAFESADEYQRDSSTSIVSANASRVKQSLRTLEEFSKALDAKVSRQLEGFRYRFYELEKRHLLGSHRQHGILVARTYALIDGASMAESQASWLERLFDVPPDVIQLRDKQCTDLELWRLAEQLKKQCDHSKKLLVINDRPDIARGIKADGVHVGQTELPISLVRQVVGTEAFIGWSTHGPEQAQTAESMGADYIGAGPTFNSQTKSFDHFPGLDYLKVVPSLTDLPAFAIGGISPDNVQRVMETGVRRVALSGCLSRSERPDQVLGEIRRVLEEYPMRAPSGVTDG